MKKKSKAFSRIAQKIIWVFLVPIERMLLKLISLEKDPFVYPVFVIGPPRSGTTLLYQILTNRFNFIYLDNLSSKLYVVPLIGVWLSRMLHKFSINKKAEYSSNYGKTASPDGPSEAGDFWYRWFPRGEHVYVAPNETHAKNIQELRRQVLGISKIFNMPMLFKNTYNSMRIAPIMEAFPDAIFIVSKRDPLDTAQSILEGRIRSNGNKDDWWSAPPKEVDEIKNHPYWEQVVEQVYYIYKQIEDDASRYGKEHFLYIPYRQLCENPQEMLEKTEQFLKKRGVQVNVKGEAPEEFPYSSGKKINDEDYALLLKKVNELWKA